MAAHQAPVSEPLIFAVPIAISSIKIAMDSIPIVIWAISAVMDVTSIAKN